MAFWIFMLVMAVLTPGVMVGFGWRFQHRPPAAINGVYGYRTRRSMKSRAAWVYAHCLCGRLWQRWGLVLLGVSVLGMALVLGYGMETVAWMACGLCVVQLAGMLLCLLPVERALERKFDALGQERL